MAHRVVRSLKDPLVIDFLRLSNEKKLRYAWRKCIISSHTLIEELAARYAFLYLVVYIISSGSRSKMFSLIASQNPDSSMTTKLFMFSRPKSSSE